MSFEDCAFMQDLDHFEKYIDEIRQYRRCVSAIVIEEDASYKITFTNCVFIGFHHAITCSSSTVELTFENCIFKKQYFEALYFTIGPASILVQNCLLKKSGRLGDGGKAGMTVINSGKSLVRLQGTKF